MKTKPLPATTTEQQDIVTAGQRRVNIIWETTQRLIAIMVTSATTIALFLVAVGMKEIDTNQLTALMQLVGMTLLVLGFYFGRTNHTQTGGIGKKTTEDGFNKER